MGGRLRGALSTQNLQNFPQIKVEKKLGILRFFQQSKMQLLGLNMVEINMPACVCLVKTFGLT